MSEFSQNFHYKTSSLRELKNYLKLLSSPSAIIPLKRSKLIPFITTSSLEGLLEKNNQVLIFYHYSSDYCLEISIYDKSELISSVYFSWSGSKLKEQNISLDMEKLLELGLFDTKERADRFWKSVNDFDIHNPYSVPETLGLKKFEWLSLYDLKNFSQIELKHMIPNIIFLNMPNTRESKILDINEWCELESQADYMYLPIPNVVLNEKQEEYVCKQLEYLCERISERQLEFEQLQKLELFRFYHSRIPFKYKYLVNKMIQTHLLSSGQQTDVWKDRQKETMRAITSLIGVNEVYLSELDRILT